jgi:hypothetical protein
VGALFRFNRAAAGSILSSQNGVDHGGGASHAGLHRDCVDRTIQGAGPALHAGVPVPDLDLSVGPDQDRMGADEEALSTTDAFLLVELQRDDIFEIDHPAHKRPPLKHGNTGILEYWNENEYWNVGKTSKTKDF